VNMVIVHPVIDTNSRNFGFHPHRTRLHAGRGVFSFRPFPAGEQSERH
jgi:hypothetical protein